MAESDHEQSEVQNETGPAPDQAGTDTALEDTAAGVPVPGATTDEEKEKQRLERILKIRVPVIVRIADRRMTIENILKLSTGSIIQFDKDAYQLIDLMVNNSVIGLGQPVKIGENFGIRIVQIGDITDTIKSLGQ